MPKPSTVRECLALIPVQSHTVNGHIRAAWQRYMSDIVQALVMQAQI